MTILPGDKLPGQPLSHYANTFSDRVRIGAALTDLVGRAVVWIATVVTIWALSSDASHLLKQFPDVRACVAIGIGTAALITEALFFAVKLLERDCRINTGQEIAYRKAWLRKECQL